MFRSACHTISHMAPATSWQISPDNGPQRRVQRKGSWDLGGWPVFDELENWACATSWQAFRGQQIGPGPLWTQGGTALGLFRGKSSKEVLGSKKILCWWWPIPIINFCELLGVSFSIPRCSDWGWSWLSEPNLSGTCFALVQLLKHNEKLKDAKERAQRRLQNYMICHLFFFDVLVALCHTTFI